VRADRRGGGASRHRSGCPGLMTPTQRSPSSIHAYVLNVDRRAVFPQEMLGYRQTARRLRQSIRETNWLVFPIQPSPRIAPGGILEDESLMGSCGPHSFIARTRVVIRQNTTRARLNEQIIISPSVTCTGVRPRPASDIMPVIRTPKQTT